MSMTSRSQMAAWIVMILFVLGVSAGLATPTLVATLESPASDAALPNTEFSVLVSFTENPTTYSLVNVFFEAQYDSRRVDLVRAEHVAGGFVWDQGASPDVIPAPPQPPANRGAQAYRKVSVVDFQGSNTLLGSPTPLLEGPCMRLIFRTTKWPAAPFAITLAQARAQHEGAAPETVINFQNIETYQPVAWAGETLLDSSALTGLGAPDVDQDLIPDFAEVTRPTLPTQTNRFIADSDGDGLLDGEEDFYGTNPRRRDTDNDGLWDSLEILLGTDPVNVANRVVDADNDGYPEEVDDDAGQPINLALAVGAGGLNGADPDNTKIDTDGDGYADGYELAALRDGAAASDPARKPKLGDINNLGGGVDIADVILSLNIFESDAAFDGPSVRNKQSFDVNRNGSFDLGDVLLLLNRFDQGARFYLPQPAK